MMAGTIRHFCNEILRNSESLKKKKRKAIVDEFEIGSTNT